MGEDLWKYIEDFGSPFSDFLQRNPQFNYQQPIQLKENATEELSSYSDISKSAFTGRYKTKTGAIVRSKSEKIIADFLEDHGYRFRYEKTILLGKNQLRPDFYLPECNLYIEHLGLLNDDEYRNDWKWRESLYKKYNLNYIITTENDIKDIDKNLLSKLVQKDCKPLIKK